MNTETVTVQPKGEDFEIIVQHDQSGSAYGITLSKSAYEQLRQHFVGGQSEQLCECDAPFIRTSDKGGEYCGICEKDLD